ncbi:MAG: extracellular solute-binding protein [Acidimicrobiales bacterium]|nr:extracellular solute-binding protein [Acidimicrobiales bacterium]MDG2218227.1 extracellular solute-binding protein [Acidimicrobiales bacterium]
MTHKSRYRVRTALLVVLALIVAACGSDADADWSEGSRSIVLYSGRDKELVQPLIDAFTESSGITVEVRYADSAELALLIQTEGDNSPADVFISQSPGALGLLAGEDRLATLPDDLLGLVDAGFAASDGRWVGLSGRVRVVVYNAELVDPGDLPTSVLELAGEAYAGRVAVAPTNGSFQDFVTAMRSELGDEATLAWLEGLAANRAPNYPKNSAIVEAVGRGEVEMGLVNHYYNLRALEADPSVASVNHFLPAGDVGSLVIVTGGAVLASSDASSQGEDLLRYLLSIDAQSTFSTQTQEYPLLDGVAAPDGLPALSGYAADTIDYDLLGDGLTGTIELIRESGIEQ